MLSEQLSGTTIRPDRVNLIFFFNNKKANNNNFSADCEP